MLRKSTERDQSDELDEFDDKPQDEEIDIVVAHIRRLARTAGLEFALRVGAVIIHHFYDGDTNAWRSRGSKTLSFRRLAKHPDLPLSAGALYRCCALFELCERLNAPSRWEHLGTSHLRLVLGLPFDTQERLLAQANANRWTVKILQREVLRERSSRVTYGGRRADPPIAKSLKNFRRCIDEHRNAIQAMEALSPTDLQHSMQLLQETRMCLEHLSNTLQEVAFKPLEAGDLDDPHEPGGKQG